MRKILDAHGLMVFLEKEAGSDKVESLLVKAVETGEHLLMSTVNLGEVYYIVLRECGLKKAEEIERAAMALPIDIVDVDWEIAKVAASIKASKKMSYADCFAAALARIHKGEVITGDKEFKTVEGEVKIFWL
ncbi:MAG TPA: type II toxin-antitoxin system VapC family toxin [Candidatus Bathyarchaeia archaeon]|nr:type II toxin-antitoxin system VapC family toxin [Candidatus Bathyarchaeia archaeon]